MYNTLGSHPKKLFYAEDMEVLTFVYRSILKKMKTRNPSLRRGFWNGQIKFIHCKTFIDESRKVTEAEISDKPIDQLVRTKASSLELRRVVLEFFFRLQESLVSKLRDPIYIRLEHLLRAV